MPCEPPGLVAYVPMYMGISAARTGNVAARATRNANDKRRGKDIPEGFAWGKKGGQPLNRAATARPSENVVRTVVVRTVLCAAPGHASAPARIRIDPPPAAQGLCGPL